MRWVLLLATVLACSPPAPKPALDLVAELGPQASLLEVQRRWERSELADNQGFIRLLEEYAQRYPAEPSTRRVRAYLAVLLLEQEQLEPAAKTAALVQGQLGAAEDLATIVQAALLRRKREPLSAFRLLDPLFNRVIDLRGRTLLNEELLLLSIELGRWKDAARYFRALVTQSSGALRVRAELRAPGYVEALPSSALLELLQAEVESEEKDRWVLSFLAKQLAKLALEKGDPETARALLALVPELLGDNADALLRVAARGADVRLERNTVGLVMPLGSDALRARGIDVARGLAIALGLPGGSTRLVVRDHRGDKASLDDTLALLNADGAAVIVAGFDAAEADQALAYGERTNLPVMLLTHPKRELPSSAPVFVLGDDPKVVRERLVFAMLTLGRKRVAVFADDRRAIDFSPAVAAGIVAEQPCSASRETLEKLNADALVLDGDADCGARAVELGSKRLVGVGLRAETNQADVIASAGLFPNPAGDHPRASEDPMLAALINERQRNPTWWMALGHDAGLLVKDAILGLSPEADDRGVAVAMRKRIVTDAIATAEAKLWTTSASGFGGGRVLPRDVLVSTRR